MVVGVLIALNFVGEQGVATSFIPLHLSRQRPYLCHIGAGVVATIGAEVGAT